MFEPVELVGEWPAGAPSGIFTTSHRDGRLWIDHADPRIVISLELLDMFVAGDLRPEVSVRVRDEQYSGPVCWLGAVIRIEAANRTVIYRLAGWYPSIRAYLGEFV